MTASPGGEIGRRKGLKIPRPHGRAGSIPAPGTINIVTLNECFSKLMVGLRNKKNHSKIKFYDYLSSSK